VAPAPVYRVPLLNTDVHDLDGLGTIADLLFGADATGGGDGVGPDRPTDGSTAPHP